eukprot:tig00000551_g2035.t1
MTSRGGKAGGGAAPRFLSRDQLQSRLVAFKRNGNASDISFPPSLTNVERRNIHEICEALGLGHQSVDADGGRFIRVYKLDAAPAPAAGASGAAPAAADEEPSAGPSRHSVQRNAFDVLAQLQLADAEGAEAGEGAAGGSEPDEEGSEREGAEGGPEPAAGAPGAAAAAKRKKKKTKKKTAEAGAEGAGAGPQAPPGDAAAGEEDPDMAFLRSIDHSKCGQRLASGKVCGASVATIGRLCAFCKLKFCLEHSLPEVHGCGEDAKRKARGDWLAAHDKREPWTAEKKTPEWQRDYLARKLEQRIGAAQEQRAAQRKPSGAGGTSGAGAGAKGGGRGGKT